MLQYNCHKERRKRKMTVGKIFYSSWGYEQTNIDFYKVVEVSKSGKTITLQKIGSQVVEVNGYCSERVIPNESKTEGAPLTNRRLIVGRYGDVMVNVSNRTDYRVLAFEWDGTPRTQTSYY